MAKKKKRKKQHRFFWFMVKLQIVLMLLVLGGLGYYYFGGYAVEVQELKKEAVQLVSQSDDETFIPAKTCSIYDVNGNLISETNGDKDAVYVKYEDIPADFVTAMISIEDKKFYQHNGVDYKAILRAVKAALEKGEASQGGSTVTMQLAKLVYLDSSKTWERKVEQIFVALELEKRYSKNKIMEFYLNNIYFANGYYGIATEGSNSEINISGGTVEGEHDGIILTNNGNNIQLNVLKGNLIGRQYDGIGVYANAIVNIGDGTKTIDNNSLSIYGKNYGVCVSGDCISTTNYNNGTLKGTIAGYTGNVNIRNGYTANSVLTSGVYVTTLK